MIHVGAMRPVDRRGELMAKKKDKGSRKALRDAIGQTVDRALARLRRQDKKGKKDKGGKKGKKG
jgi:hypothetical protein